MLFIRHPNIELFSLYTSLDIVPHNELFPFTLKHRCRNVKVKIVCLNDDVNTLER